MEAICEIHVFPLIQDTNFRGKLIKFHQTRVMEYYIDAFEHLVIRTKTLTYDFFSRNSLLAVLSRKPNPKWR
jgi:hypothetical protein